MSEVRKDIRPQDPEDPNCAWYFVRILGEDRKPTAAAWALLSATRGDAEMKHVHRAVAKLVATKEPEGVHSVNVPMEAVASLLPARRILDPERWLREHPVIIHRSFVVEDEPPAPGKIKGDE